MSEAQASQGQQTKDLVLSANNIEVIYDHVILVLRGVSLEVPRSKIVVLLALMARAKRLR